ncbi:uncharacterized protein LOC135691443 [Rhopilema esculentum]|uniref:uncharacterized protein LOC135691443 n=1 Tax=Rhopilema esculentum TaxID=499914 RepID=UPI0031E1D715
MKHPKMEFKLITTCLLWFFSLFFIYSRYMNCRILRLPCQHFANFTVTRKGYALLLAQISVYDHLSVQECKAQCVFNQNCKAISYNVNGTCILNSESPADSLSTIFEGNLTQETGWSFMSTNYSEKWTGHNCKRHNPCGDSVCLDTCQCPGFQCVKCGTDASVNCPDGHPFLVQGMNFYCLTQIDGNTFQRLSGGKDKFYFVTGRHGLFLKHQKTNACVGLHDGEEWLETKACGSIDTLWRRNGSSILWNAATKNCLYNYIEGVFKMTSRAVSACYMEENKLSLVWD